MAKHLRLANVYHFAIRNSKGGAGTKHAGIYCANTVHHAGGKLNGTST